MGRYIGIFANVGDVKGVDSCGDLKEPVKVAEALAQEQFIYGA